MSFTKLAKKSKNIDTQQLDFVEKLSSESQTRKKRFFVSLLLGITISLSLAFWVYRQFTRTPLKPFKFSLNFPQTNSHFPVKLKTDVQKIINSSDISFYLKTSDPQPVILNLNLLEPENFNDLINLTEKSSPSSSFLTVLPQGILVKENKQANGHFILISNPQRQIYLYLKYKEISPEVLSQIVDKLYWGVTLQN